MTRYVYPGSFCPPTLGHLHIVRRAAELLPSVTVICSTNKDKNNRWFTEDECKQMWSAYRLPHNVSVKTFDELRNDGNGEMSKYIMIRGIRNTDYYSDEEKVMGLNHRQFGISNFLYIVADPEFAHISSSLVRAETGKLSLETLHQYVAPSIISRLLEHVLGIKNLFMVVGRPASGKTTFLGILRDTDTANVVIETDRWNDSFKPFLKERFACDDLVQLVLKKDSEVSHAIKDMWFAKLKESLMSAPKGSNVFVEVAYGLAPNKSLFRFLGGKTLYLGCENDEINRQRMIARGTPELIPFLERIPGLKESQSIAHENNLSLVAINTLGMIGVLYERALDFSTEISAEVRKEERDG